MTSDANIMQARGFFVILRDTGSPDSPIPIIGILHICLLWGSKFPTKFLRGHPERTSRVRGEGGGQPKGDKVKQPL